MMYNIGDRFECYTSPYPPAYALMTMIGTVLLITSNVFV